MKKTVKSVLISILVVTLVLSSNLLIYRKDIKNLKLEHKNNIELIHEYEWSFIEGVITENSAKSKIHTQVLADEFERRLKEEYPDLDVLKSELEKKETGTKMYDIMRDVFSNVYMNDIQNDSNDPIIAMEWGVIGDYSLSTATQERSRNWDEEVEKHFNTVLFDKAVKSIMNKDSDLIFWEQKLPTWQHETITDMSLTSLKHVYEREGIEGLQNYEMLTPIYISPNGDIFGEDDILDGGIKNKNLKIIIIQSTNIYDQLQKAHPKNHENVVNDIKQVDAYYDEIIKAKTLAVCLYSIVLIISAICLMLLYNKLLDDEDEDI